jgi:hypothetical protein
MRAILRLLAAPLLLVDCASAPPVPRTQTAPAPSTRPAPVETSTLADRGWGVLRAPSLGLKLALPEAKAWLAPTRTVPGAGWELRHEPTGSTLSVRRWRASRLPRVEACEADLRARTPDLPNVDDSNLVSRRDVRVPEGFVTRITLVAAPGGTTRVAGQAIAVGAGVGESLAAIARTECATETELAERLRLLDVALAHLRLTRVEDRVPTPQPISR